MVDYIDTTLFGCKDTINFAHLGKVEAEFSNGLKKYCLDGCEKLKVYTNEYLDFIRIEGSLSYYFQGHNFTFAKKDFVEAVKFIANLLNVPLWRAEINQFEYGVIVDVESRPKDYILHHTAKTREHLFLTEKEKDRGNYRNWEDTNVKNKMYDASRNIKHKQGLTRQGIIAESGWNPEGEYLKWEAHYLKPEFLNHGRAIHLFDLCSPDFSSVLKEDLYQQYKRLVPMKEIVMPTDKKNLTTSDIILLAFAEEAINTGQGIEELKKVLYNKVNACSDAVLTKSDKDARKRQIKQLLDKLEEEPESRWDLSKKIEQALYAEK